jgi:hypothetical protein
LLLGVCAGVDLRDHFFITVGVFETVPFRGVLYTASRSFNGLRMRSEQAGPNAKSGPPGEAARAPHMNLQSTRTAHSSGCRRMIRRRAQWCIHDGRRAAARARPQHAPLGVAAARSHCQRWRYLYQARAIPSEVSC